MRRLPSSLPIGWLAAVAEVDDGEPAKAEADACILGDPEPGPSGPRWTIVSRMLGHERSVHAVVGTQRHDACDAAHQALPVMRSWTRKADLGCLDLLPERDRPFAAPADSLHERPSSCC